ncbi:hypothetical protein SAMN05216490_3237 [Mucilaginibacter mallensis]|uniref:Uncharacterized protein n=2 Tax=Mucilaginibacter mallensis TaxID=652787 RepID=A0A1H1ZU54_MUCMA|nr:hypothetical protein SAMN05216490_3237 [Mucilaginibacter mallensis]
MKVDALRAALDWEQANRDFQFRRTNISRAYQYKKIASSNDSNGILNYNKRLTPLGDRFKQDFLNALARLQVCSLGLDKIYGYSAPLPNIAEQDGLFDDCITWTRNAINYYNRFSKLDQTYVLRISLRNLLIKSTQPFNPEKQSEIDTTAVDSSTSYGQMLAKGIFQFNIDEHLFLNQKHVRIRGINMFVSLTPYKRLQANIDMVNGCIMAEIIPPPTSYSG